jgi:large subunit ribosomal protein L23
MKDPRDIIIRPVVSEKSYSSLEQNVYTFVVDPRANKTEIKDAIQRIFEVKVLRVNTMWRKGKEKRTRYTVGTRSSTKRAVVTLAEGDSIEIFNPK